MSVVEWFLLLAIVAGSGLVAYLSYRRHSLKAQARSRAALNRLLAEADEIAQRGDDPEAP